MSQPIATSQDWKTLPFGACREIPYRAQFSKEETTHLKCGLIPAEMEDKWFVYFEDNTLHFHRSWTGHPVFKVVITETETSTRVSKALIEASFFDDETAVFDAEYQAAMLNFLVSNLLLGKSTPFPIAGALTDREAAIEQHVISGTGYPSKVLKP